MENILSSAVKEDIFFHVFLFFNFFFWGFNHYHRKKRQRKKEEEEEKKKIRKEKDHPMNWDIVVPPTSTIRAFLHGGKRACRLLCVSWIRPLGARNQFLVPRLFFFFFRFRFRFSPSSPLSSSPQAPLDRQVSTFCRLPTVSLSFTPLLAYKPARV